MTTFILEGVDPRLFNVYASILAEVLMMLTGFVLSELYRFLLSVYLQTPGNTIKLKSLGRMPADLVESIKVTVQANERFWKCWPAILITILFLSDHATTIAFAGLDFTQVQKAGPNETVLTLQKRNQEIPYGLVGDPTNPATYSQLETILQGGYDPQGDENSSSLSASDLQALVKHETVTNSFLAAADAIARGESIFLTKGQGLDPYSVAFGVNYDQEDEEDGPLGSAMMSDMTSLFVTDSFLLAMDSEIPLDCNDGNNREEEDNGGITVPPMLRFTETRGIKGDFTATSAVPDCTFTSIRSSGIFGVSQQPQVQVTGYQSYQNENPNDDEPIESRFAPENPRLELLHAGSMTGVQFNHNLDAYRDPYDFDFPAASGRLARDRVNFRQGRTVSGFGGVRINDQPHPSGDEDDWFIPFRLTMFAVGGSDTVLVSYVDDPQNCGQDPSGATDSSCYVITSLRCDIPQVVYADNYWTTNGECNQVQQVEIVWGRGVDFDDPLLVALAGTYGRNLKYSETLQEKRSLAMHSLLSASFSLASLKYQPSITLSTSTEINGIFLGFMAIPVVLCLIAGAIRIFGNRRIIALPDDGMKMWLLSNESGSQNISSLDLRQEDEPNNSTSTEQMSVIKSADSVSLSFRPMDSTLVIDDSHRDSDELEESDYSAKDTWEGSSERNSACSISAELRGVIVSMLFCALLTWGASLAISSKSIDSSDTIKLNAFGIEMDGTAQLSTSIPEGCFSNSFELDQAVVIYFEGSNESKTELIEKFGTIDDWCTSFVDDFSFLFYNRDIEGIDVANWNVSNGILFDSMFGKADNVKLNLSTWDTGSARSFQAMFILTRGLELTGFSNWDTSRVQDMNKMFQSCGSTLGSQLSGFSNWDTSRVRDMSNMFYSCETFNDDLSSWSVGRVTDFSSMFTDATLFNSSLSAWDTSSAIRMNHMFSEAESFSADLSNWNVDKCVDLSFMFYDAHNFQSDLSSWKVGKNKDFHEMFSGATVFNSDLSSWNTSSGKRFDNMFAYTSQFSSDLSSWNMSSAQTVTGMFSYASEFSSNLCSWIDYFDEPSFDNTSAVGMFYGSKCPRQWEVSEEFVCKSCQETAFPSPSPSEPPSTTLQPSLGSTLSYDVCEGARDLGSIGLDDNLFSSGSTREASLDNGSWSCVLGVGVWYTFTSEVDGFITVSLCGSSYDTVIALLEGDSCNQLSCMERNDDSCCGFQSQISQQVTANTKYYVYISGYASDTGLYDLAVGFST